MADVVAVTPGRLPGPVEYLVVAAWAAVVLALVAAGVFEDPGDVPVALIVAIAVPLAGASAGYVALPGFRSAVLSLDLRLVLGIQTWRVLGGMFLFLYALDVLPAGFAFPAGLGDAATGVAALAVVVALGNGTLTRGRFYGFTALGLGDFVVAIGLGVALRPDAMVEWPLVIVPAFFVPAFAVLHLVAIWQVSSAGAGVSP